MLDKDFLTSEIRKINDPFYELFGGWPASCSFACLRWTEAFYLYSKEMLPPSDTFLEAKAAFLTIIQGICSSNTLIRSATIFANAIMKMGEVIAPGIEVANPKLKGIMPPTVLNLIPLFTRALNGELSSEQFAIELAEITDVWFRSGTAIIIETGVIINWN